MTVLSVLWRRGALSDERACLAMLRAQWAAGTRRAASFGELALGSAIRPPVNAAGPMLSPSGAFAIAADCRIDNRSDFQTRLGLGADESARLTDVDFVGLALDRWGVPIIGELVGDFALIVWQRGSQRLH